MRIFKYSLIILLSIICQNSFAQFAWIDPPEPDVREAVTVYVDVAQDPNCQKLASSEGPLYIWTWGPSGPVSENGNGGWDSSNEEMVMTHEEGTVWSFTFIPAEFYDVANFKDIYNSGLDFLVKEKDGGAGGDCSAEGEEYKTGDIHVNVPSPFVEPVYSIPDVIGDTTLFSRTDDIFTLIYDNKLEEKPTMIGATNLYIYPRGFDAAGTQYIVTSLGQLVNNPELKMQDNGSSIYSFSFIPDEFFADVLPDGGSIETIQFQIVQLPLCGSDCAVDGEFVYKFTCD